jgi:acetyltransferase-like isoleucine patch superfamily enzyme
MKYDNIFLRIHSVDIYLEFTHFERPPERSISAGCAETMTERKGIRVFLGKLRKYPWETFWMQFSGTGFLGRLATRTASIAAPAYKGRRYLARLAARGYVSPNASIYHGSLSLGRHIFIGDRVTIYQVDAGTSVSIGDGTHIHQDSIIETGQGGHLTIASNTHIQPRCQFSAYKGSIAIGSGVQIAPNCAFYPYDHSFLPGETIMKQPLETRGGIIIEDDAWLGYGVVILDGVRIGKGAVIGAGAVVTQSIPDAGIAVGIPARLIGMRSA